MTSASSSSSHDVPFIVRDRRRKGFFTIDNVLLDVFGAILGPYGLVVYMALARFANQEATCWPSLATIAKRTGISRRQVIREINNLQGLRLIAVEAQFDATTGEHRANHYILLDLTPSDPQSPGSDGQTLGGSDHQTPPSDPQSPKQNSKNKIQHRNYTQRTTPVSLDQEPTNNSSGTTTGGGAEIPNFSFSSTTETPQNKTTQTETVHMSATSTPPPSSDTPPSPTLERQQTGASALIAVGMTVKVAYRLAEHYSLERIEEKLDYLDFLQQCQPDTVHNPCGWLRKAIEDDFAAPDGFVSPAVATQQADEYGQLMQEEQERSQQNELARQQAQEAQARQQQAYRTQLTSAYGTTDADQQLWHSAQQELRCLGRPALYGLIADAEILQCTEETALIGVVSDAQLKQLSHPGMQKAIQRSLSYAAGRTLTPQFVHLPGVDAACPLVA